MDFTDFSPFSVSVIGDELLAAGLLKDTQGSRFLEGLEERVERSCVLRSTRCNSEENVMEWREERDWPTRGLIRSTWSIEL